MAHNADLVFYHSKSDAVADGEAGHDGLGGRISADLLSYLQPRPLKNITGVDFGTVVAKNLSGSGALYFDYTTTTVRWKSPRDSVSGDSVSISAGGAFEVESETPDAWIELNVTPGDLPSEDVVETVILDAIKNVIFTDVTAQQAEEGRTDFACIMLKNDGAVTYDEIHPFLEFPSAGVAVDTGRNYAQSGGIRITVASVANLPNSSFVRNTRTREIMYYNSIGGETGKELIVAESGRGMRGTSPANGIAGDTIELVAPIDMFVAEYDTVDGDAIISAPDIEPELLGDFFYPDPTDTVQYPSEFSLAPGEALVIWLRRTVPRLSAPFALQTWRLGFSYQS